MKYLLDFFMDKDGNLSVMRLGFYTIVLGAVCFAFVYPDYEGGYLGMLAIGAGLKYKQKKVEKGMPSALAESIKLVTDERKDTRNSSDTTDD